MCQCGCGYEDWSGSCTKRRGIPCPYDEEEMYDREAARISNYELRLDMERVRRERLADMRGYDDEDDS